MSLGVRISWWVNGVTPNSHVTISQKVKNVTTLKCDYAAPSERGTMRQNIPKRPTACQVKYDISQSNFFHFFVSFTDEARERGSGVLVHCHAGVSRSATVTVAYIMKQQGLCLGDAYKFVKELRPVISPNLNFMGQLLKYEKKKRNGESSQGKC